MHEFEVELQGLIAKYEREGLSPQALRDALASAIDSIADDIEAEDDDFA